MVKAPKRYYWLKLQKDFFQTKEVKRLRRIAGGDTFTVIYLKMMLKSLETGGKLYYEGFEDSFISELAMDIDEEETNVSITVQYLLKYGLIETIDESEYIIPKAVSSIGSETAVAERVRRHREKEKALQSNASVTQLKQSCNVEIEKEIEKEIEIIPPPTPSDISHTENIPNGGVGGGLSELYLEYQSNGFGQISWFTKELLDADFKEYGIEWCKQAMLLAIANNCRKWKYVQAILKRWLEQYGLQAEPWKYESEGMNGVTKGVSEQAKQDDPRYKPDF